MSFFYRKRCISFLLLPDAYQDLGESFTGLQNLHLTAPINMWAASLVALLGSNKNDWKVALTMKEVLTWKTSSHFAGEDDSGWVIFMTRTQMDGVPKYKDRRHLVPNC